MKTKKQLEQQHATWLQQILDWQAQVDTLKVQIEDLTDRANMLAEQLRYLEEGN